jgi:hypothetical protein
MLLNVSNTVSIFVWLLILALTFLFATAHMRSRRAERQASQTAVFPDRRMLRTKFKAMLISALAITTVGIVVLAIHYAKLGIGDFLASPIESFMSNSWMLWFSGTFGQYLLCLIGWTYLFALCTTGIAFLFSYRCKSSAGYLSGVTFSGIGLVITEALCEPLFNLNYFPSLSFLTAVPFIEAYVGIVLVIALALLTRPLIS